jgi:hypothetical protein
MLGHYGQKELSEKEEGVMLGYVLIIIYLSHSVACGESVEILSSKTTRQRRMFWDIKHVS